METKELSNFSDEELKNELKTREKERQEQKRKELERKYNIILNNVDVFLELANKHDRTSCSDDNVFNSLRCTRCTLLEMKQAYPSYTDSIEFIFYLTEDYYEYY